MTKFLCMPLTAVTLALAPAAAQAGTSCFEYETETASAILTLLLPEGDGAVAGIEHGGVQDHKQGYFTSWENAISGRRVGDKLEVNVDIAIEEDRRTEKQVWRIEDGAIVTERERFEPVECESAVDAAFDDVPEHASEDITRGHCSDAEDVILTCEVDDDRVLSVCASGDRSQVAYRFGPVVAPELEFPRQAEGSAGKFMVQTIGYSGGYDTRLGFRSGPYTYMVYERMISRGAADPEKDMEGGVMLFDGKELKSEFACRSLGESGVGIGELFGKVEEKTFFDEQGLVE